MSKENDIVIIAAYPVTETASKDFDQLVKLVEEKKVDTDGMILVQKRRARSASAKPATTSVARAWAGAAVSACWSVSSILRCWPR